MVNYRRGYRLTSTQSVSPSTKMTMLYTSFVSCECAPWIFLLPAGSFLQRIKMLSVRQNTSDPVSTRNSMGPILLPSSPSTLPSMLRNSPTAFSSSNIQQRPMATMHSLFTFSPNAMNKLTINELATCMHAGPCVPAVSLAGTSLSVWVAIRRADTIFT